MFLPILIALVVTTPILALGTWLYLRRRKLSPRVRILLMTILFLFVLISGPAIVWMWGRHRLAREFRSYGRAGAKFLGNVMMLWFLCVGGTGVQLWRLWRKKGEL